MRLDWIFSTRFHFGFILQSIAVMSPFVLLRVSLGSSRHGQNTFCRGRQRSKYLELRRGGYPSFSQWLLGMVYSWPPLATVLPQSFRISTIQPETCSLRTEADKRNNLAEGIHPSESLLSCSETAGPKELFQLMTPGNPLPTCHRALLWGSCLQNELHPNEYILFAC